MDPKEMEQLPGNSFIDNTQKKSITRNISEERDSSKPQQAVATGREKKKSFIKRFAESFFVITKDDIEDKLLNEWLVPSIKNMIEDAVHMFLFGGRSRSRRRDDGDNRLRVVSYDKAYDESRSRSTSSSSRRNRKPELVFDTREDAQRVYDAIYDYFDRYNRVPVKELYSLANMPTDFTMNDWGWFDLSDMSIVRVEEGYLLDMPTTEPMKRR